MAEATETVQTPEDEAQATSLATEELPAELHEIVDDLEEALEVDVPVKFPEDTPYPDAKQVEALADVLIRELHEHLEEADIWFVFRQSLNRNKTPIPGRSRKTGPRTKEMSGYDFTVDVNHTIWANADAEERVRIVDELLTFCSRDPESGAYEFRTPEVITHHDTLARWGPREGSDLEKAVQQLRLL